MPLASSGGFLPGVFASARARAAKPLPNGGAASRAFHNFLPRNSTQPTSTAQRLLRQTRSLVQAFVGHLTTPGTLGHHASAPTRSLHHLTRGRTIQSGLSNHVRHALAQPLGAPKLPRPPAIPRSVFQVGLGTARKFSTGRPIFAHLAENVPVTGRALVEADWDLRLKEEKGRFMKENAKEAEKKKKQKKVKEEKISMHPAAASADAPIEPTASELEHYFPAPAVSEVVPGVTTTLLIPLAPTPSSRLPLSALPKTSAPGVHPVVPFVEMSTLHYDFAKHNERVAELFNRLDGASVWDHGARCDVYGDARGGANVLRVAFEGWEAHRVRAVIGETGSGWCVLEEDRDMNESELDAALDALDHPGSPLSSLPITRATSPLSPLPDSILTLRPESVFDTPPALADFGVSIDPAHSFVLPTLDFSSSFEASSMSGGDSTDFSDSDAEYLSDPDYCASVSDDDGSTGWIEPPSVRAAVSQTSPVDQSWLFSSAFSARMEEGPIEDMF